MRLWQEAIRSNLHAQAAAKAYAVRNRMPGAWDKRLYVMDYLAYAYLQGAQDKQAWRMLASCTRFGELTRRISK